MEEAACDEDRLGLLLECGDAEVSPAVSTDGRRVGVDCVYAEGIDGTGGLLGESYEENRTEVGVLGMLNVLGGRDAEVFEAVSFEPNVFLKKPLVLRIALEMD